MKAGDRPAPIQRDGSGTWVRIDGVKLNPSARRQGHESYQRHRRQVLIEIVLPIAMACLIIAGGSALTAVATFRDGADVGRWAAISTIWMVIPIMIAGLVALALLLGVIYLLGLVIRMLPKYSIQAQRFAFRFEDGVERATTITRRPALILQTLGGWIGSRVRRARERM